MRTVTLQSETDFEGWRNAARSLAAEAVAPEHVHWRVAGAEGSLFDDGQPLAPVPISHLRVPRRFLPLARRVIVHRAPDRFAVLYRLLWRLQREPRLLSVAVDEDVARAVAMAGAVRRDVHKMKAFVRFREVDTQDGQVFVAWFEPEHHILEAVAPFFMRRFAGQRWSILTPRRSVYWDGKKLQFSPGAARHEAPAEDAAEELWKRYYASIFNPARLKVATMQSHMPQKYWRNLPESSLIPQLVAAAEQRTAGMLDAAPTPVRRAGSRATIASTPITSLEALSKAAESCRRCPLWTYATQAVGGEGPPWAPIALVGEQPGDQEDLAGKPFVGPAGQVLDLALARVGLPRHELFVTNAVKHFKFELRGKRRLHKKPNESEIAACHEWLERELAIVQPKLVIALGATAARALTGETVGVEHSRAQIVQRHGEPDLLITVHPAYLLRIPQEARERAFERFVADLQLAMPYLSLAAASDPQRQ